MQTIIDVIEHISTTKAQKKSWSFSIDSLNFLVSHNDDEGTWAISAGGDHGSYNISSRSAYALVSSGGTWARLGEGSGRFNHPVHGGCVVHAVDEDTFAITGTIIAPDTKISQAELDELAPETFPLHSKWEGHEELQAFAAYIKMIIRALGGHVRGGQRMGSVG